MRSLCSPAPPLLLTPHHLGFGYTYTSIFYSLYSMPLGVIEAAFPETAKPIARYGACNSERDRTVGTREFERLGKTHTWPKDTSFHGYG
ncbi:hypothetical protein D9758_017628 [Tetrapyrgos nigripes]|uniref:Uncharacterized protein n=1 Tax=Tetrapyrgos nigripes TaxID=182062 RepID=A0A8H5FLK3_9AGAR|nr:hypothetical protein D9758_017628 [Tetrapyrgos nigripes]